MSRDDLIRLSRQPKCPRCDFDKTWGTAICRRCRNMLPRNMRASLEGVEQHDEGTVYRALRAAANYFDVHFQSIRSFGGGRKNK